MVNFFSGDVIIVTSYVNMLIKHSLFVYYFLNQ